MVSLFWGKKSGKPNPKNRVDEATENAVVACTLEQLPTASRKPGHPIPRRNNRSDV